MAHHLELTGSCSIPWDWTSSMRRSFSPRRWLLSWMPASLRTQAIIAELLSQALSSDMKIVEAIDAASNAMRGSRLRKTLASIAGMVRNGEEVGDSFRWAGLPLHAGVQAAMEVGEAYGDLSGELAAAGRVLDPSVFRHLNSAIGRRKSATHFATALARLLSQQPMTVAVVHDAARIAGGRDRRFARVIRSLPSDIEGGGSLSDGLMRYPDIFDPMFINCVERAQNRASMCRTLLRLSGVLAESTGR
jgi:type II secretory pathway component PulF